MNLSTKFAVSVHILSVLYYNKDVVCNSEYIAGSVNTNPVVIRRLVSSLKKAGLLNVSSNQNGIKPTRKPEDVRLYEIYDAVDNVDSLLFGLHRNVNVNCPVGRNINSVLQCEMDKMQTMLRESLNNITMADVMNGIYKEIEISHESKGQ